MSKFKKSIAVIAATLALVGTSVSVANATPTANLTYAQFAQTQGYLDFQAAAAQGAQYLSNQSGLQVSLDMSMNSDGADTPLANIAIDATKTVAKISITSEDQTFEVYFADGVAYSNMSSYKNLYGPDNIAKVITRIPNSSTKVVKMTKIPGDLTDLTPSELFSPTSNTYNSLLSSSFADLLSMFQFSEVTKAANPNNETQTDYSWDMVFSLMGMSSTIHQSYTLDANSMLISGTSIATTASPQGSMSSTTHISMIVNNELSVSLPDVSATLDEAQIKRVSNQIIAEGKSSAKASAIVKKATELAKKAKAQVSAKHLADAAKALKYTVTKITNGVKLTATVSKVQGNLCVTAVRGKTSIKNC